MRDFVYPQLSEDFQNFRLLISCHINSYHCAFPTRTVNLCYTRISALHRKTDCLALPAVAIAATATTYWLILHTERLLLCPQDRNFAIGASQYRNLNLVVSTFSMTFTSHIQTYSASILASHICSFIASQQVVNHLHWVDQKTLCWNI